ncbi:MAG: antibiotic biosynthesis monooxygenase [Planctomycetes bacterium]|nr:antibiotic biosynthesis monooxygenase [Planctomycetota bacterium]
MIHVIATIEVVAGKRDEYLAAFHQLVPLVLAEDGCIEYGPTIDVATPISIQEPVLDNTVTVIEKWESIEALQAHLQAKHMQENREKVKDMLAGIKIQILEPA